MISRRGRLAFANARVRARRSRLFDRAFAARAAGRAATRADGATLDALAGQRVSDLIDAYATVLASYPTGQQLLLALARRIEVENVKLAWRAAAGRHPFARWSRGWTAMGPLETVSLDAVREHASVTALAAGLRTTPYAAVAASMARAHPADPAAAEMGIDAWTTRALVEAAAALPGAESRARDIAFAIARERDLAVVRRSAAGLGVPADAVATALVMWPRELTHADITRLAGWQPGEGPLWARLPRGFVSRATRPADWDALALAWRLHRRDLCRRAFLDQPFSLAPAAALLVLEEEEVRGLRALAESAGDPDLSTACERVLAGGAMGA